MEGLCLSLLDRSGFRPPNLPPSPESHMLTTIVLASCFITNVKLATILPFGPPKHWSVLYSFGSALVLPYTLTDLVALSSRPPHCITRCFNHHDTDCITSLKRPSTVVTNLLYLILCHHRHRLPTLLLNNVFHRSSYRPKTALQETEDIHPIISSLRNGVLCSTTFKPIPQCTNRSFAQAEPAVQSQTRRRRRLSVFRPRAFICFNGFA